MTSKDGQVQTPIAPHYYLVQEEFTRLRDKIEGAMARPARPMGLEIVDGKAALKIWEQYLRKSTRRLPALFRAFSMAILSRSRRPSIRHTQQALIPIEQEIAGLIALHRQLWQQPLPPDFKEGQELLSRCIEKIAADLHDLFAFFITTVELSTGTKIASASYLWQNEIGCQTEMAEYSSWFRNVGQPYTLAGIFAGFPFGGQGLIPRLEILDS